MCLAQGPQRSYVGEAGGLSMKFPTHLYEIYLQILTH